MIMEPLDSIFALMAAAWFFRVPFDGPYIILSLLVFSLTFPGHAPRGTSAGAIARDVLTGWILIVGLLLMLGWATRTIGSFDERVLVTWVAVTPVLLFASNMLAPIVLPKLMAAEGIRRKAVIAGAGSLGRKLAERIAATPYLGVEVAGFFDDRSPERLTDVPGDKILGGVDRLSEYVKHNQVDLIYIALPMASQPRILKLLDGLCDTTASVYFAPDIFLFDLIQARMDTIGGIPVVAVCETPFYGVNGLMKRVSDIVLASLILVLISPVMAALALGVKI